MRLSLQMTRVGTETGSGACRSEEAEEKEPVVWSLGGAGGGPGLGLHTKSDAKRGGRPWQLREGVEGSHL